MVHKNLMKALTTREFVSLAAIAVIAPVLALGAMLAAQVMVATGSERMLLALTLGGAVMGWVNGFGRRTVRSESRSPRGVKGPQSTVVLTS